MPSPPSAAPERAADIEFVVDGSVILDVCLAGGQLGPLAGHELHAPAHLPAEVCSAMRELAWRGEIPAGEGRQAAHTLSRLEIAYAEPGSLAVAAWSIAEQLGWAKTYDAEYVALAAALAIPLVTLDARLQRGAGHLVSIRAPIDLLG
jgi:predicted nucleic acid-binding protein